MPVLKLNKHCPLLLNPQRKGLDPIVLNLTCHRTRRQPAPEINHKIPSVYKINTGSFNNHRILPVYKNIYNNNNKTYITIQHIFYNSTISMSVFEFSDPRGK